MHGDVAGRSGLAFADQLTDVQDGGLVYVEVDVYRIDRHDGGKQGAAGLPRLDQIAHRDEVAADAAADGRDDFRVLQVQPGLMHGRPQCLQRSRRFSPVARGFVELLLADRPFAQQALCPREVRGLPLEPGLHRQQIALGLLQRRLVGARVDLEKDVALLDQGPFLEVDLVEVTPHAGAHLDGINRGRPGGEIRVIGDVPLNGVADRDRCCRWRFRGRPRATDQSETEPENQCGTEAEG